jgi:hypothetical protein
MELRDKIVSLLNGMNIEDVRKCCDKFSPFDIGIDQACMDDDELETEIVRTLTLQLGHGRPISLIELALDLATTSVL